MTFSINDIKNKHFDWDKGKYFYYVVKFKSLSEAAKALNLTQPSLSRLISNLERELGCKLLIRSCSGIQLTRKGEELYTKLEQCFMVLRDFTPASTAITNDGKTKIRISATHPVASYILNEHLLAYNELHPEIVFEVIANDAYIDLAINDVDLAIRPYDHNSKGIEQEYLFTMEKKLFASQAYVDKYGKPQTISDLREHHLIAQIDPEKHPYSDIHWILKLGTKNGEIKEPSYTSNSFECLVEAVERGFGIISCYEEMKIIRKANLVRILTNVKGPEINGYISYPSHLKNNNFIISFKDYLCSAMNKHMRY